MSRFDLKRRTMVERQLTDIDDGRVLAVMGEVPRHEFVPAVMRDRAYDDAPLPIDKRQTISQPWIVARMTALLDLKPSDQVLEIGTGSGYQTAVLARLCRKVVSVERHSDLAKQARSRLEALGHSNVTVLSGDGSMGRSEFAPYEAILVTAGAPNVPGPLKAQLALGGRLVAPVGDQGAQQLLRLHRREEGDEGFEEERFESCRFVPLLGRFAWKEEV